MHKIICDRNLTMVQNIYCGAQGIIFTWCEELEPTYILLYHFISYQYMVGWGDVYYFWEQRRICMWKSSINSEERKWIHGMYDLPANLNALIIMINTSVRNIPTTTVQKQQYCVRIFTAWINFTIYSPWY